MFSDNRIHIGCINPSVNISFRCGLNFDSLSCGSQTHPPYSNSVVYNQIFYGYLYTEVAKWVYKTMLWILIVKSIYIDSAFSVYSKSLTTMCLGSLGNNSTISYNSSILPYWDISSLSGIIVGHSYV